MASSTINLRALGLNFSGNALELNPGSMLEANNVIIRRDDVVESRRGYKLFGEPIPSDLLAKQLLIYRNRIIRHYGDRLAFQDGQLNSGIEKFTEFGGNFLETKTGLRIKGIEEKNGNFYFTSIDGVKKISAKTPDDFIKADELNPNTENYITAAGGIKALDLNATLDVTLGKTDGFLPENSAVAYKMVWGKVDKNDVELLGTPSERVVVYNDPVSLLKSDFNKLLIALNNLYNPPSSQTLINETDYTLLSVTNDTSVFDLRSKLISLSEKLDKDLKYAAGNGPGAQYTSLDISNVTASSGIITIETFGGPGSISNTFTVTSPGDIITVVAGHPFITGDIVTFSSTGALPNPLVSNQNYYVRRINNTTFRVELVYLSNSYVNFTSVGSGTHTVTLNNISKYFSEGQKINLQGFTSNNVDIVSLNKPQIIQDTTQSSASISFSVDGYSTASPLGISGVIASISTAGLVTTSVDHGLTVGQKVTFSNTTGSSFNVTGTITAINTEKTFTISSTPASAVTGGLWNIFIDSPSTTTIVESYKYRSIVAPDEIDIVNAPLGTAAQISSIRTYLSTIIDDLKLEGKDVIAPSILSSSGISSFTQTTSANVRLEFTVPYEIDSSYFYRIYRSEIITGTGTMISADIIPSTDYFFLSQTAYDPASKSPVNFTITYDDSDVLNIDVNNPEYDSLKLYTSGTFSGDQSPNDYVPYCSDINSFNSYTFYANTKLKQIKGLNLLGLTKIKNALEATPTAIIPKLLISDNTGNSSGVFSFEYGKAQISQINIPSPTGVSSTSYITIYTANNAKKYVLWFDTTGTATAPSVVDGELIRIYEPYTTQSDVGNQVANTLNLLISDFSASYSSGVVTINYLKDGFANLITFSNDLGTWTSSTPTPGVGESITNKKIVLPSNQLIDPEQQLILTIKSLQRVINRNTANITVPMDFYCYYDYQNKGNFIIEGSLFKDNPYYFLTSTNYLGESFNPYMNPIEFSGNVTANPSSTSVTFPLGHGFLNEEEIVIFDVLGSSGAYGVYPIKYISSTVLEIVGLVIPSGAVTFKYIKAKNASKSTNFKKKNRIYYSKFGTPEAVYTSPYVGNFIDIGSEEKEILRIFPLRESLFVFKEDGLWRISGTSAPFSKSLFDTSVILIAPDSVATSGNVVYSWTTQGIMSVSESGATIISRPIDTEILKLASVNYTGFASSTFGVGYESDNSYIVWTIKKTTDELATQAFRYSFLTQTWTKYSKTNTCGVLNQLDDKLYLGAGDTNYLEQERKQFNRYDYADREYTKTITPNSIVNNTIKLSTVQGVSIGDVVVQNQLLTVYKFNSLMDKLDNDPSLAGQDFSSLKITTNANLRNAILDLANKLEGITGQPYQSAIANITAVQITAIELNSPIVITSVNHGLITGRVINISSPSGTADPDLDGDFVVTKIDNDHFSISLSLKSYTPDPLSLPIWSTVVTDFYDIYSCYNEIVTMINSDPFIIYSNYQKIEDESIQEATITDINIASRIITLDVTLPFVEGEFTLYSAIPCDVLYSPITFGDSLMQKQIREATMMFSNKAFTSASLSFSTDLLPVFNEVQFFGDGKGLFGHSDFGSGFFGGGSNSAPFRTYVPQSCQRCRFINLKFTHRNAREQFAIYGLSLTGKSVSSRAYR